MGNWNTYRREERVRLAPGDYRVEIVSAEEAESKKGKDMIVVGVRPNGSKVTIRHYIVEGDYFNVNATELFDSFGIEEGNFNLLTWIGAVGAARLKEDDQGYLKVAWFLSPEKAAKLPPWEGPMPERQTVTDIGGGFGAADDDDDDLPFL